jgi:hypothetical protein
MAQANANPTVVKPQEKLDPTKERGGAPAATAQALPVGTPFEQLLVRAGVKGRASLEKHLALCDAEPSPIHAELWKRLLVKMGTLAPMPVQMSGAQAVMFFVADGKYRLQIFALEDLRDGKIAVYLTDVLSEAVAAKLLKKSGSHYIAPHDKANHLAVELINSTNTPDPAPYFKHMIGWNRKAIKLAIDATNPDNAVAELIESLCELAAKRGKLRA